MLGAATLTYGLNGLAALAAVSLIFAAVEMGWRTIAAFTRSLLLVLPLALFMAVIWIGVVGRSPAEIASGETGTRAAAAMHVALICMRLFIIVFTIQSMVVGSAASTPLRFIRALRLPITLKRLLVVTLSLIETFRHAIDRSYAALTAAGLLTSRASVSNLLHGWILVQTVWLTTITIVVGRLRDKWPIENTLKLLDAALAGAERHTFSRADTVWLAAALGVATVAIGSG